MKGKLKVIDILSTRDEKSSEYLVQRYINFVKDNKDKILNFFPYYKNNDLYEAKEDSIFPRLLFHKYEIDFIGDSNG